jgi:hypothetical protein
MIPHFPNTSPSASDVPLPKGGRQLPIVGWRTWRVRPVGGGAVLVGAHSGASWDRASTQARCRRCPPWLANLHPVPDPACECGLYACCTLEEALHNFSRQAHILHGCGQAPPVVGAVIGWGRIVQYGGQGWRAGHARPVALLQTGHALLDAVATYHRVPVVSAQGLRLLPLEYGEALAR